MVSIHANELALWAAAPGLLSVVSTVVWAAGLTLEGVLAFLVFSRRIARRFPAFAALMVFYPLRAVALFACARWMGGDAYELVYRVLSHLSIALQILLAGEIGWHWIREASSRWRRYGLLPAIAGGAGLLAWMVAEAASGEAPADGLDIFVWLLMVGLFAVVVRGSRQANLIPISAGFAAFSVLQLVALAGRVYALLGRNASEYLAWSYVPAGGYIAVVVFWLVVLQRDTSRAPVGSGAAAD